MFVPSFMEFDGRDAPDLGRLRERLSRLPITQWSYREEPGAVRHVGPMAQDFHRAFGLGADNRHIHPVDAAGVTMAAIQALHQRLEDLERKNAALQESNRRLTERLDTLAR